LWLCLSSYYILVLSAVLVIGVAVLAFTQMKGEDAPLATYTGEVVSVDQMKNEIVVKNTAGEEMVFTITTDTEITHNGTAITLADIQPGASVTIEQEESDSHGERHLKAIHVTGESVAQQPAVTDLGEVVSVDQMKNEIVIKTTAGEQMTLTLSGDTEIVRDDQVITLADIKPGASVTIVRHTTNGTHHLKAIRVNETKLK
jgi:arginine repressor